jgi:SAM-dependent methyltransferase
MDVKYIHTEKAHNLNAPLEIVPIIVDLFKPKSVLDVGCGIGTWLKAFESAHVTDYVGLDGAYVDRSMLMIPEGKFISQDLEKPFDLNRKFDLVISFEVAEHLSGNVAKEFVHGLVAHGDVVIFSAAIPFQGGQNHLNEQWPSWWAAHFADYRYNSYDIIRSRIWDNPKVDVWYKQNMLVYCKEGNPAEKTLSQLAAPYADLVHPDLFSFYARQAERAKLFEEGKVGIGNTARAFFNAVVRKIGMK